MLCLFFYQAIIFLSNVNDGNWYILLVIHTISLSFLTSVWKKNRCTNTCVIDNNSIVCSTKKIILFAHSAESRFWKLYNFCCLSFWILLSFHSWKILIFSHLTPPRSPPSLKYFLRRNKISVKMIKKNW